MSTMVVLSPSWRPSKFRNSPLFYSRIMYVYIENLNLFQGPCVCRIPRDTDNYALDTFFFWELPTRYVYVSIANVQRNFISVEDRTYTYVCVYSFISGYL